MAEFNGNIFELAISREIEAYYFYKALADKTATQEMRKVFEDLAEEELGHKAKLELEIIKAGKTVDFDRKLPEPRGPYIVSDDNELLDIDYKDMLLLGMEKEEAAFRIYVNLIPRVNDEHSREILFALAEEEVRHKLRFQNEYDALLEQSKS